MTANALPEQVRAFRQAGMDDYIAKPFKQQDLHEAIRRVVDLPLLTELPESATGRVACRS
jgi:CheY-like chemotaxis protein